MPLWSLSDELPQPDRGHCPTKDALFGRLRHHTGGRELVDMCKSMADLCEKAGKREKKFLRQSVATHFGGCFHKPVSPERRQDMPWKPARDTVSMVKSLEEMEQLLIKPMIKMVAAKTKTKVKFNEAVVGLLGSSQGQSGPRNNEHGPAGPMGRAHSSKSAMNGEDMERRKKESKIHKWKELAGAMAAQFSTKERVEAHTRIVCQDEAEETPSGLTTGEEDGSPEFDEHWEEEEARQELSLLDAHDEDEPWTMPTGGRKRHKGIDIEEQLAKWEAEGKLSEVAFPRRRKSTLPRVRVGTTVRFGSSRHKKCLAGHVRQVVHDEGADDFVLSVTGFAGYVPKFVQDFREKDFLEMVDAGVASAIQHKEKKTSLSSGQTDVFVSPAGNRLCSRRDPVPFPHRHFEKPHVRAECLVRFKERMRNREFLERQVRLLEKFRKIIYSLPREEWPERLKWKSWIPAPHGSRWHKSQTTLLCVHTNGVGDRLVKQAITESLAHRTKNLPEGETFDNPINICRDPKGMCDFAVAKAKINLGKDMEGMSKGLNHCFEKAKAHVAVAKQLVWRHWATEKVAPKNEHPDVVERMVKECVNKKVPTGEGCLEELLQPVDPAVLEFVLQSGASSFPKECDNTTDMFMKCLFGVGTKIRHLVAECGCRVCHGPALDVHTIRHTVDFGIVAAAMSGEEMSRVVKEAFPSHLCPALNEVPGALSQLLRDKHEACQGILDEMWKAAKEEKPEKNFECFMRHHQLPKGIILPAGQAQQDGKAQQESPKNEKQKLNSIFGDCLARILLPHSIRRMN